jgi:hypothetical protein
VIALQPYIGFAGGNSSQLRTHWVLAWGHGPQAAATVESSVAKLGIVKIDSCFLRVNG